MRKFYIGLVSLGIVAGVFLLYTQLDKTETIDTRSGLIEIIDSNIAEFEDINNIPVFDEGIGVGVAQKSYYINVDDEGNITEEYGFERLISDQDGVLLVKGPYRNLFLPDFNCYMTADNGSFDMETAGGSTTAKDATFSGNVVIKIVPTDSSDVKESTIYLDNLVFLGDKSQLSTEGPVRFISEDVQIYGTGMEFVYNSDLKRLELFWIVDLESLNLKVASNAMVLPGQAEISKIGDGNNVVAESMAIDLASNREEAESEEYYQCLLSSNVMIDSNDQKVFADREAVIKGIFWEESGNNEAGGIDEKPADSNDVKMKEVPSEKTEDVVITCDNGIVITPEELSLSAQRTLDVVRQNAPPAVRPVVDINQADRTVLLTGDIEYNILTGNTLTGGYTELTFLAKDPNNSDPEQREFPVHVTSHEGFRFFKELNQAVFIGDCLLKMPQRGLSVEKDIVLSSSMLTINMAESTSSESASFDDIVAAGPAELIFYIEDSNISGIESNLEPVKITAQNQARYVSALNQIFFEGDCVCTKGGDDSNKEQSFSIKSPMFTVNLPTDKAEESLSLTDIVASGPVEADFYVENIKGKTSDDGPLPATISAQEQAQYLSSSNQVMFEGSCKGVITREDPNIIEQYILMSQRMLADISEDSNNTESTSAIGVKNMTADGGTVTLAAIKKAKPGTIMAQGKIEGKQLSGIELKGKSIKFDGEKQLFLASGPGVINMYNSEIKDPNESKDNIFSDKEWWAEVKNYETVTYLPNENRIIADASTNQNLDIIYITVEEDKFGPTVVANAGHVDIQLSENPEGTTELSSIVASGGINYRDEDNNNFSGSRMFYDASKSLITIEGDRFQQCYLNGVRVKDITVDLETGKVEFEPIGSSTIQLK